MSQFLIGTVTTYGKCKAYYCKGKKSQFLIGTVLRIRKKKTKRMEDLGVSIPHRYGTTIKP